MNAHVSDIPAIMRGEIRAFVSLARRQSRLSVQYRNWASEADLAGRLDAYKRWSAESRRLRLEAGWHLTQAIRRKEKYRA